MSADQIRLTIVTDSAERASLALFGFSRRLAAVDAPWCRFVDRTHLFSTIPDGAPVMALWFDIDPLMDIRWFNERHRRVFDSDWGKHAERIADWLARREEKELALIAAASPPAWHSGQADDKPAAAPLGSPPPAAIPQTQQRTMWS